MQQNNSSFGTRNLVIGGVIIVTILISIGAFAYNSSRNNNETVSTQDTKSGDSMTKTDDKMMVGDKTEAGDSTEKSDDKMIKDDSMPKNEVSGKYAPYSSDLLANAKDGNVVIFFNATWCPTCRSTVKNINENLNNIPSDLTILSADYDKETSLRRKYGVTTQHTFVKVDANGDLIKKESGLDTVDAISDFAK